MENFGDISKIPPIEKCYDDIVIIIQLDIKCFD